MRQSHSDRSFTLRSFEHTPLAAAENEPPMTTAFERLSLAVVVGCQLMNGSSRAANLTQKLGVLGNKAIANSRIIR
jgi:hypothetical protein